MPRKVPFSSPGLQQRLSLCRGQRRGRIALLRGLVLLAAALAGGPVPAGEPSASATSQRIDIRLEERPDGRGWNVVYELSEPVRGLLFLRRAEPSRQASWQVSGRGTWTTFGEQEAIVVKKPASRIRMRLPCDSGPVRGDYLRCVAFSDGSRMLYSGQLAVRPLVGVERLRPYDGPLIARWDLRTEARRGIRTTAGAGTGRMRWRAPSTTAPENGTYFYFGDIEPLATERMTAILDPGLPEWTARTVRSLLPRLFDHYADELGIELESGPLVLVSSMNPGTPGLIHKGGTLDGLIQLSLGGRGWQRRNTEALETLSTYLAHEAFHMWNAQRVRRRLGRADRWLSEGAASYFAYLALQQLGRIDAAGLERRIVRAANRCIDGGQGVPMIRALDDEDVIYACGEVVLFLTDRALRRATDGRRDIVDLFAGMFSRALAADGTYSRFDFLAGIRAWVDDPREVEPIDRLLHRGSPEPATFFMEQLSRAGLAVQRVPGRKALQLQD